MKKLINTFLQLAILILLIHNVYRQTELNIIRAESSEVTLDALEVLADMDDALVGLIYNLHGIPDSAEHPEYGFYYTDDAGTDHKVSKSAWQSIAYDNGRHYHYDSLSRTGYGCSAIHLNGGGLTE